MPGISLRDAEQARLEITRDQAVDVEKLYRAVYKDMRKQLKSMTSGGATSSLRKTQLRQLTESLKEAYNTLGPQLESSIIDSVTSVSQAVVDANNSWMASAGLSVKGAYAYVPQDIVTMLASGKLYSDGWTLSKAIWGESQQKAHDIDLIVARGVAANKSAFEIAKDLEKYVNPGAAKPWDWSKVYPGSSKKVDYNAQRLARTMVSHAYQQSLERVCSKNPFVDGYKWIDAHTDRTCQLCIDRATVDHYGMGEGVYPKGELPLDHPNGMCTFTTHMTGDLDSISNRLADWANGVEDPALDQWASSMFPNATWNKKPDGPTEDQKKWLSGYDLNNPPDFMTFFGKLDWNERAEFMKWAGVEMNDPQAFQKLEQAYNTRLYPTKQSTVQKVKESVVAQPGREHIRTSVERINSLLQTQSNEDFLAQLEEESARWWAGLTKEQQEAIRTYTGGSFKPMNEILRGIRADDPYYRGLIQNAQAGMDQFRTGEDMVVRRGSKHSAFLKLLGVDPNTDVHTIVQNKDQYIGSLAEDKGFFSTTPHTKGGFGGATEYRIMVPQGAHMPYLEKYTMNPEEYETLLPPGTVFRVVDMGLEEETYRAKVTVYLEAVIE